MSSTGRQQANKNLGESAYLAAVLVVALIVTGASYISDGPVAGYVHITIFILVVLFFYAPRVIWKKISAKTRSGR